MTQEDSNVHRTFQASDARRTDLISLSDSQTALHDTMRIRVQSSGSHLRSPNLRTAICFAAIFVIVSLGCDFIRNATTLSGYAIVEGKPSYVYTSTRAGREVTPIAQADPDSFEVIQQGELSRIRYAHDKSHVFVENRIVPDADPKSFRIISGDGEFSQDRAKVFFLGAPIESADPETFQLLGSHFGRDAKNAYIGTMKLPGVQVDSWKPLEDGRAENPWYFSAHDTHVKDPSKLSGSGWSRDADNLYYGEELVSIADVGSFEVLGNYYAKDRKHVYNGKAIVANADPATFHLLPGPHYANPDSRDAKRYFRSGRALDERTVAPGQSHVDFVSVQGLRCHC